MSSAGYIYVLVNASFPSLVKIGKTRRAPTERAAELSSSTGVPTPFIVVTACLVSDCDRAESCIHESLMAYRVNESREFFAAPIEIANKILHQVAQSLQPTVMEAMHVHAYGLTTSFDANDSKSVGKDHDLGDTDELFHQALDVLRSTRRASTSMLQRRLRIGNNRATRIMEIMANKGIVGPENGSSPREILVDLDTYDAGGGAP